MLTATRHTPVNHQSLPNTKGVVRVQETTRATDNALQDVNFDFTSIGIQPKLKINPPNDPYEQEADRIAQKVVQMKEVPSIQGKDKTAIHRKPLADEISQLESGIAQRKCSKCNDEEEEHVQRKSSHANIPQISSSFTDQLSATQGGGSSLDSTTSFFMSSRFGVDFSNVRIHNDSNAHAMSQGIQAKAFTRGSDIYFNQGTYAPHTQEGKELLAHELVHTLQQGETLNRCIQRAYYDVGSQRVNIDYAGADPVYNVTNNDLQSEIERRYINYTSAADATAISNSLSSLANTEKRWVLYGLDALIDNTTTEHSLLNRTQAVQRLIDYAPNASSSNTSGNGRAGFEALRVSGWFEVALSSDLQAPTATDDTAIDQIVNPTVVIQSGQTSAVLDTANFHARMEPALRHLLSALDPANFTSQGTRNFSELQSIGDTVMEEAKSHFSPYADTSRTTVFGLSPTFHMSSNIFDVSTIAVSQSRRIGYLRNRGGLVGRNVSTTDSRFSDINIFRDTNFDGSDSSHQTEFNTLITNLLNDTAVSNTVDRLIHNTGRQTGSGANTSIGLATAFDSSNTTDCEARWEAIDTLCHEVLHALAHPDFESTNVSEQGVLREGFTEVLGVDLYNNKVKPKASSDASFKATMEAGISGCPNTPPHTASVGYGAYGKGASDILALSSVTEDDFRAAYFLGQAHLIGL